MSTPSAYPFGQAVQPLPTGPIGPRDAFVLAPVPGALPVRWTPPGQRTVSALPVADEPECLWDGHDAAARVAAWQQAVGWDPRWGAVGPSAQAGANGRWLQERILAPLHLTRDRVCLATCLDTYRAPAAVRHRITTAYLPVAVALNLPAAHLQDQEDDDGIIQEVLTTRIGHLNQLLAQSMPSLVVTLGGTAYRVAAALLGTAASPLPRRLPADPAGYGRELAVAHQGRALRLLALAHPAAPRPVQRLHDAWLAARAPVAVGASA